MMDWKEWMITVAVIGTLSIIPIIVLWKGKATPSTTGVAIPVAEQEECRFHVQTEAQGRGFTIYSVQDRASKREWMMVVSHSDWRATWERLDTEGDTK